MEIFRQILIVFNVISAFLDHLKPEKNFLPANHGGRHTASSLLKISGTAPVYVFNFFLKEKICVCYLPSRYVIVIYKTELSKLILFRD